MKILDWGKCILSVGGLCAMGALSGCGHGHDHGHDSAAPPQNRAEHEITVWGERHEVFTVHSPPVAGKAVQFVVHVTDLLGNSPRTNGPIPHQLRLGAEPPLVQTTPAPAAPGIYQAALNFPTPGEWAVAVQIPEGTNVFTIEYPAIQVHATEAEAIQAPVPEKVDGIAFLKEQQWTVGMASEPVGRRDLLERIAVPAHATLKPGHSATVPAPVAGILAGPGSSRFPSLGARVEAGDLLGVIRPRFSESAGQLVELEAAFGRAQAELQQASRAYDRIKGLVELQARSQRELQEAEAVLASARAAFEASAALRNSYSGTNSRPFEIELRAPITGVIAAIHAGPGEPIGADAPVMTVQNTEELWIDASVPEPFLGRIAHPEEAVAELLDGSDRSFSITAGGGRLLFRGGAIDPVTRTSSMVYEVPNPDGSLRPGQTLRLLVGAARSKNVLAIPYSALIEEGGVFVAYVQAGGETFQKRELRLGVKDGEWIEVQAGITEGERVVSQGAYAIRLAALSGALPEHTHEH